MSRPPSFIPGSTFDYLVKVRLGGVPQPMVGWSASLAIGTATDPIIGGVAQGATFLVSADVVWTDAANGEGRVTVLDTSTWPATAPLRLQVTLTSPTGAVTIGPQQTLMVGKKLAP